MLSRFVLIQNCIRPFILTSLFFYFTSQSIYAQLRIDKVIPPSFNAAALIKYCDHPIGTAYGIPETKIPIYNLINNDIHIPITLNYHSIGIKVEEEATWTGLGWYLNAGGMITRIIRGENDFGVSENDGNDQALGYPFEHIKPCFDDCEENENADFHQKVCEGKIDSDPDIFFYDILGNKGKFLLTPDHDPNKVFIEISIVKPKRMTLKFFIQGNYWVAEDEDGFSYTFNAREITETYENYFDFKRDSHSLHFLNNFDKATTSWYLTSVKSARGTHASFIYDITPYGESEYASNSAYHKMNINDGAVWDLHYSSYCFPDNIENVQIISENQHKDVYLKSIHSGEYTVDFTISEQKIITPSQIKTGSENIIVRPKIGIGYGPQRLEKIEVSTGGQVVSSSEFTYSYFNSNVLSRDAYLHQRLKLNGLVTTNGDDQSSYDFSYEEAIPLPSKQSHARDLWGYYNGEEDLYNITPSDFFNYSQPEKLLQEEGKTKHYSLDKIQAGILRKIDFGNGKSRSFTYDHQEFNEVDKEISSHFSGKMEDSNFDHHLEPFIFGGLRVDEITSTGSDEPPYQKFNYSPAGKETGKLIISHYNHSHHGYGHKTSGNHTVLYGEVKVSTQQ